MRRCPRAGACTSHGSNRQPHHRSSLAGTTVIQSCRPPGVAAFVSCPDALCDMAEAFRHYLAYLLILKLQAWARTWALLKPRPVAQERRCHALRCSPDNRRQRRASDGRRDPAAERLRVVAIHSG